MATFAGLSDNTAETITLKFAGGGFTSAASIPIVVRPAAASKLVIQTEPSSTATVHQPIATQPVIKEEDQFGNLETGDNSTLITAKLQTGNGPLMGTTAITLSGGVATFTNLSDNTPETIALDFTGGGLTSAASGSIVVSPAAAAKLVIQTQPSPTALAGQAFTNQPVIDEEDQYGDIETSDNSTAVTAFLASGSGGLQGTTAVTLKDGVAAFTNITDDTVGTYTLGFTGGGFTSVASLPVVVSPGSASKLVLQEQLAPTATAGQTFAIQPVIKEEDAYGNLEAGDNSTLVTATLKPGQGPLLGTASATVIGGIATFTGLSDNHAGTISLGFSDNGVTSSPTAIVVSPAVATKLVIQTQPSPTAVAGQPFSTQPAIAEEDQYNNVETGDNSTVVIACAGQRGRSAPGNDEGDAHQRRGEFHQPRRRPGRDHHARIHRRRPDRGTDERNRGQSSGGESVRHPDPALDDGPRRPASSPPNR